MYLLLNLVPIMILGTVADTVPGAKLVTIEGGSHGIFATPYQEVGAEIEAFLLSLKS